LAQFEQSSAIDSDADFAFRESQVTLREQPVNFEFLGGDILHIFLFPSEHQDRTASNFERNQRPTASACTFSRPCDPELEEPSAKISIWWRKHGSPKILIRNVHPIREPSEAFEGEKYCKDGDRTGSYPQVHFTFLGFTFRPRKAKGKSYRCFTSFLPAVSPDAMKRMRKTVREGRMHRQTSATLAVLARQYNPAIRGWSNYFGAFYRTAMHRLYRYIDQRLEQWARRKYKTLTRHKTRGAAWLLRRKSESRGLFYHWSVVGQRVG
jgi:hypothetical protein